MLHSLRLRLLLTMSLVVLAAVGTLALFTSSSTTKSFESYVAKDAARDQRVVSQIMAAYKDAKAPQDREALARQAQQLAQQTGERLIIADDSGTVVADSAGQLVGQKLDWPVPIIGPAPSPIGTFNQKVQTFEWSSPMTGSVMLNRGAVIATSGAPEG